MLYLDSIGLDIFHLLAHHRPIILSAALPDIISTVDYLTFMKFTTLEFQRIVSMCPEILNSTLSTITPIFTFLLREAGVDDSDLKRVINRRPRLLVSSVKYRLRPTLYFLQKIGIAEVTHLLGILEFGGYCLIYFIFVPLHWIYYRFKKWHYYLLVSIGTGPIEKEDMAEFEKDDELSAFVSPKFQIHVKSCSRL